MTPKDVAVLIANGGPIQSSQGTYTVRCPAHEDGTPSLSIGPGKEQPVLLYCHAGCPIEAILAAAGLSWDEITAEPRPVFGHAPSHRGAEAVYSYHDEQGSHLFDVVRFPGKRFKQCAVDPTEPSGYRWNLNGTRRVLYRLPEVLAAVQAGQEIWVTEGEKDVETLRRLGLVATCNPQGAGKWQPEFSESMAGASVTIWADNDDPGREHAQGVRASLMPHGCQVRIVESAYGKDATDHLGHGLALDEVLVSTARDARVVPIPRARARRGVVSNYSQDSTVSNVYDVSSVYSSERDKESVETETLRKWRSTEEIVDAASRAGDRIWAIPALLPEGLCVLAGAPKIGKSWLALDLAFAIASGGYALGQYLCEEGDVLYLAAEDTETRLSERFSLILSGEPYPTRMSWMLASDIQTHPVGATVAEWANSVERPTMVVFDTIGKTIGTGTGRDRKAKGSYQAEYDTFAPVQSWALAQHIAVLGIHHTNQAKREDGDDWMYAFSGTSGLIGAADSNILLDAKRGMATGYLRISGRDMEDRSDAIQKAGPLWQCFDGAPEDPRLGSRSNAIIDFIAKHGPCGPNEIVLGLGIARTTLSKYLERLERTGRLIKPERGIYTVAVDI